MRLKQHYYDSKTEGCDAHLKIFARSSPQQRCSYSEECETEKNFNGYISAFLSCLKNNILKELIWKLNYIRAGHMLT